MEQGAGTSNVQEESSTQVAGYQKRQGVATFMGEEYEVALCCLLCLRALRHASDFFLASNHDLAGIFDDVVLLYRLKEDQGPGYRAILLQAKHRERITQKAFTLSNPFKLNDYLESFNEIRHHWEHPLQVGNREIQFHEVILVLYTNTGCDVGNKAVDITDNSEVQHLQDLLSTGGRLLRISEEQGIKLFSGRETSDFLTHLILCVQQTSIQTVDSFLEQELSNLMKVKSTVVAQNLISEMKRLMKAWWSEQGPVRYITPESKECKEILEIQVKRLNEKIIIIDRHFNINFTAAALKKINVIHSGLNMCWIRVISEYQAKVVKLRLFKAQKYSLVIDLEDLDNNLEEIDALWGNLMCPTLVLDMSTGSPDDGLLQRLQEAVQSDAVRHLVIISRRGPASSSWSEVGAAPTWSLLHQVTRERFLSAPVTLQGMTVALRDVVGPRENDILTDELIICLCESESELELGAALPAPLNYYVPRCLERTLSKTFNVDKLINTNTLLFPHTYISSNHEFRAKYKTLDTFQIKTMEKIKYPIIVKGIINDYGIRQMCFKFCVRGISGEFSMKGFQGNVKEFIPLTWNCEEKNVVIEGPPGVGKSSFVTMMCSRVKQQFPESWVLLLDMGRHTDYIKDTDFTEVENIKEFLLKSLRHNPNSLERHLLKHSLSVTGNVFLFIDAFDEISPDFTKKCSDLLKGITQTIRYRQMVVTTRPVTTRAVEESLQTVAFTLPVFNQEEQRLFLQQFTETRGKNVCEDEISSVLQSAGTVLENPLLCKMLSEVLLHRGEERLLKCQNPWRRVLLYDVFVEQSVKERVAEKFGLETSIPGVKALLESNKTLHLQNLQGMAVRKLMPVEQLPPLSVSTATPEEKLGLVVSTGGRVDFEHQTFAEYFLGRWLACHWQQCPRQLLCDVLLRDGFQFVAATLSLSLFDGLPLHMAVARGDVGAVSALVSAGTSNVTDRGGRSALHVAAMTQGDRRDVWEHLLASDEDLDKEDNVLATTAIKYAESFANWEFVDVLLGPLSNRQYNGVGNTETDVLNNSDLKKQPNIDVQLFTVQGAAKEVIIYAMKKDLATLFQFIWRKHTNILQNESPLHMAAAYNSKDVMKVVIENLETVDVINENRFTPLHEGSRHGHIEAVTLLVENGADLNATTKDGLTSLTLAASGGHLEVVKVLLENGADLNIKTGDDFTALSSAAARGRLDVVKILLERGADLNVKTRYGDTVLTCAARGGHLNVLKTLLINGADLNIQTKYGDTVLTWAARGGDLDVVKILLENGAGVNLKTIFGYTALMEAARGGHLGVVKMLLQNGADLNIASKDGHTALMWAARGGYVEVVKKLLEDGADLHKKTKDGFTALTWAAHENHVEVVKILIKNGADLNTRTKVGFTPLTYASYEGHLGIVKLLLDNGADFNIKTEAGHTALTQAAHRGHLEIVKILFENGAYLNIKTLDCHMALTCAAHGGHMEIVMLILDNGLDLNIKTLNGHSPLTCAAEGGHLEVVKILLKNGADLNMTTVDGHTALTCAARGGHLELLKILLMNGANINIKTANGHTALTLAALGGHMAAVKILLENGADLNIKTKDNLTALTWAARAGNLEVVKLLLENGTVVNNMTADGFTALTWAARGGHVDVVKILSKYGAFLNIKTVDGHTALIEAACHDHVEIVKILLENGADVNINTVDGHTALTLAARRVHLKMVKTLIENGAHLNIMTKDGYTALTFAADRGHLEVVKILLENGADLNLKTRYGHTALTRAARGGRVKILKLLLENGSNLSSKTDDGHTALTWAARGGELDVVKILLENGIDLNIKTEERYTALKWAAREDYVEVMKTLLETGAHLILKSEADFTALTWAARKGRLKAVKILLEDGADLNKNTKHCYMTLTLPERCDDLEAMKTLLENGADLPIKFKERLTACGVDMKVLETLLNNGPDVTIKADDGDMLLTWATRGGHYEVIRILEKNGVDLSRKTKLGNIALTLPDIEDEEIVKSLLVYGSDLTVKTEDGFTPLSWAARGGHLKVVKLLLENGGDLSRKTDDGHTALMWAARGGHLEVVKFLLQNGAELKTKNSEGESALDMARKGRHQEVVAFLTGL